MEHRDSDILDGLLVLEARSGDRVALRRLFDRWDVRLRTHATHLLRDREAGADAAQDAWVTIVRRLGSLRDPDRFGPWALRVVTNRCRDVQRRQARTPRVSGSLEEAEARGGEADIGGVDQVNAALRAIPPDQRALLSLRYAERLPLAAIAEAMGIPVGTVKSRLHAAREGVRLHLERNGGGPADGPSGGLA